MLFNLLSYNDEEIETILRAAAETCRLKSIKMASAEGREILQRAIELYAAGARGDQMLLDRLKSGISLH